MKYSYNGWNDGEGDADIRGGALALSSDGIHWRKVDKLPAGPSPGPGRPGRQRPGGAGRLTIPPRPLRAERFMRTVHFGEVGWGKGSCRVQYSPDGKRWTDGPEISRLQCDPGRRPPQPLGSARCPGAANQSVRPRLYGQRALLRRDVVAGAGIHWNGAENFLDPDNPYGNPPGGTVVGPMRAQVFLDACAGKGEGIRFTTRACASSKGCIFATMLPCTFDHRFDVALAVSRDGLNFTRVKNGESTLPVGPPRFLG